MSRAATAALYRNYDTETTEGIAYRGIEFYEFEEKITDIAPTPEWTDDRRVIIVDRVRECALVTSDLTPWQFRRRCRPSAHLTIASLVLVLQRGAAMIGAFAVQPSGHQVLVGAAVLSGSPMGKGLDSLVSMKHMQHCLP